MIICENPLKISGMDIDKEFGSRLKIELKKARKTQDDLAQYIGVSRQAVGKWINGGAITYTNLIKISQFLQVSIDKILTGKEFQKKNAGIYQFIKSLFKGKSINEIDEHLVDDIIRIMKGMPEVSNMDDHQQCVIAADTYEIITIDGNDIDCKEFDDETIRLLVLMSIKHMKKVVS